MSVQRSALTDDLDRYRTILCLLFEVRIIAAACFILAQRVVEGENSPSLSARIAKTPASTSLPTPPSHKPNSPDASRFVVEQFQFSEDDLALLAGEAPRETFVDVGQLTRHTIEALTVLIAFYGAQDVTGNMQYLLAVSTVSVGGYVCDGIED